jgi:hypothetical protein
MGNKRTLGALFYYCNGLFRAGSTWGTHTAGMDGRFS